MTPSSFLAAIRNTESELCRIATLCDFAETKAAIALGKKAWTDETELEFITATLEWRK